MHSGYCNAKSWLHTHAAWQHIIHKHCQLGVCVPQSVLTPNNTAESSLLLDSKISGLPFCGMLPRTCCRCTATSFVPRKLLEVTRPRTRKLALYALFAVYANPKILLLKVGVVTQNRIQIVNYKTATRRPKHVFLRFNGLKYDGSSSFTYVNWHYYYK